MASAISRRKFMKVMGASLAFASLEGCVRGPVGKLVPYIQTPNLLSNNESQYFATTLRRQGYGCGVVVKSILGRPLKVDGNPHHPASLGAASAVEQSAILDLYDPDRAQGVKSTGKISYWDQFLTRFNNQVEQSGGPSRTRLHLLTQTITSPGVADQIKKMKNQFPLLEWHAYDPLHSDAKFSGQFLATGGNFDLLPHFDRAQLVVTLDHDFLSEDPGSLRYARDFMSRRRIQSDTRAMSRLIAVESCPGLVGAVSDHRFSLPSGKIPYLGWALARSFGLTNNKITAAESDLAREYAGEIFKIKTGLEAHRGSSLILAGKYQPAELHYATAIINQHLGNFQKTLDWIDSVESSPLNHLASLQSLVEKLNQSQVDILLILEGNPVYDAPSDFLFEQALNKAALKIHLSPFFNETSILCDWQLPQAHELESWGDARAFDGTISITQPLIAPLYSGKSIHEVLSALQGQAGALSGNFNFKDFWSEWHQNEKREENFENFWEKSLKDGILSDTAFSFRTPRIPEAVDPKIVLPEPENTGLEVQFRADIHLEDGRRANNAWLQELPRPLTKLTWDNAALISPQTAHSLHLKSGDWVWLHLNEKKIKTPLLILPGHAEDSVTLPLGYGRKTVGRAGEGVGFNAYEIRTSDGYFRTGGGRIENANETYPLAITQEHSLIEGRDLARITDLQKFLQSPQDLYPKEEPPISLYPDFKNPGSAWGMVINLQTCIGCNACVIACQAENNIPVVGKQEVLRGREMHWLRIDRYYRGEMKNPETLFQPILCMHCEKAPCEVVCPVAATTHSNEGLNEMTYNRCVGTRYCSNNCPYKVRRFNFLEYNDEETPVLKLGRNPEVTVRSRGVMEKCTYCVQRITHARIQAEKEMRPIREGEVVTACQATCPTESIIFGDLNQPESQVVRWKSHPLNYHLLHELGTRPRTSYLARVKNSWEQEEDNRKEDHH